MNYYPYLRAKQFELKALRELVESYGEMVFRQLFPILEPLNKEDRALNLATEVFLNNGLKFALVVNPTEGDYKHSTVRFMLPNAKRLESERDKWIPTYIVSNKAAEIQAMIVENGYEHVMLLFPNGIDEAVSGMEALLGMDEVQYVVSNFAKTSRSMKSRLRGAGKTIICLDDNFKEQPKNADYAGMVDELFTENVFYYEEDGYSGYSDYTALPSALAIGGMLPYAVAIHMTYKRTADQIYIHHFVSDTNDTNQDTAKKFTEAGRKAIAFYEGMSDITPSAQELVQRAINADKKIKGNGAENAYPGLGYLKKLSIKNHIELLLNLRG